MNRLFLCMLLLVTACQTSGSQYSQSKHDPALAAWLSLPDDESWIELPSSDFLGTVESIEATHGSKMSNQSIYYEDGYLSVLADRKANGNFFKSLDEDGVRSLFNTMFEERPATSLYKFEPLKIVFEGELAYVAADNLPLTIARGNEQQCVFVAKPLDKAVPFGEHQYRALALANICGQKAVGASSLSEMLLEYFETVELAKDTTTPKQGENLTELENKLKDIQSLLDKGLITEEEAATKRQSLLANY